MNIGSPIVFSESTEHRRFLPLTGVSFQRDDPNSFDERLLQELIDATPNVLPVREYLPSTTAMFSLGREVPLDLGGFLGRIDNLLVTNDGYLVIVETKLYRNPEGIREVIAQTLQYGMAVGQMPIMELEARIKRGQSPALKSTENIRDCVSRLASWQNLSGLLADDFEEALERNLRRGEVLLLIVSDGIHVGVERVTSWLNERGNSSPFKLGLVELKFYVHGSERLVIPHTVLKTREVSRHTVVVDIRPSNEVNVSANVDDDFLSPSGGKVKESRSVKVELPPLTKNTLLQQVAPEDLPAASQLVELLTSYGFDQGGTGHWVHYGLTFPNDGGTFHPLVYLGKNGVATYPLRQVQEALGSSELTEFHRQVNEFARFFNDEQIDKPNSQGCSVKYRELQPAIPGFVAYLAQFKNKVTAALQAGEPN